MNAQEKSKKPILFEIIYFMNLKKYKYNFNFFNWIKRTMPKKAVLTHLGWESDYDYIMSICPENVYPGYDGMVFKL